MRSKTNLSKPWFEPDLIRLTVVLPRSLPSASDGSVVNGRPDGSADGDELGLSEGAALVASVVGDAAGGVALSWHPVSTNVTADRPTKSARFMDSLSPIHPVFTGSQARKA